MRIAVSSSAGFGSDSLRWERNFLYIFIITSGFFIIFPQADLAVTRCFFRSGSFFIADNPFWVGLRDMHRVGQWYLVPFLLLLVALYALWERPLSVIAPHKVLYVILTYALGPGVLVQSIKFIIGRARPRNLMEFGGGADFTPAWQLAAMCSKSCSFPSGEGAAAAAMLPLLILVPDRYRALSAMMFIPVLVLLSLNRVFMGAHFLSDVVIAWTLILGLMLWLWPRISRSADAIDNWVRAKGKDILRRLKLIV